MLQLILIIIFSTNTENLNFWDIYCSHVKIMFIDIKFEFNKLWLSKIIF